MRKNFSVYAVLLDCEEPLVPEDGYKLKTVTDKLENIGLLAGYPTFTEENIFFNVAGSIKPGDLSKYFKKFGKVTCKKLL